MAKNLKGLQAGDPGYEREMKRRDEERREQEAGEVLTDFRKGRISAAMRDRMLNALGYEYEGSQAHRGNNGGGPRHRIGSKG